MKTKFLLFIIAAMLVQYALAQPPKPIPGQYIVILKESAATPVIKQETKNSNRLQKASDNESKALNAYLKLKGAKMGDIKGEYVYAVVGYTAVLTPEELAKVKANPDVQGIYQDFEIKLPPKITGVAPPDIQIAKQYTTCSVTTAGGPVDGSAKNTWIWILDTGIDGSHPDLNVQTVSPFATSFITGESWNDVNGHGTHLAGIAAAKNNSIGVAGVSAGAKVVPVKVLNAQGSGPISSLIAGLNHVAMYDIPNDVVCIPVGAYPVSDCVNAYPALRDAIVNLANAGTWVVMSAGYSGGDAANFNPGCINGNRICTVGSLSCLLNASSFSNFSSTVVDWVAVGENVYSTLPGSRYGALSGTALTVPVVAGIIHSKGAAPVSGGTVNCRGADYRIAHR